MFHRLFLVLKHTIPRVAKGKVDVHVQISLLAAMKLLRTNLNCLKACKTAFSQIVKPEVIDLYRELRNDYLPSLQPFETNTPIEEKDAEEIY